MSLYIIVFFSYRNVYVIIVFYKLVYEVGFISKNIIGFDLIKFVYIMYLGFDKFRCWFDF